MKLLTTGKIDLKDLVNISSDEEDLNESSNEKECEKSNTENIVTTAEKKRSEEHSNKI